MQIPTRRCPATSPGSSEQEIVSDPGITCGLSNRQFGVQKHLEEQIMTSPLIGVVGALSPALGSIDAQVYEYVLAANGLFVRAEREGLKACIPVQGWFSHKSKLNGLHPVDPYVELEYPRLGQEFLAKILECSRAAASDKGNPLEALFYLKYSRRNGWELSIPEQEATSFSVHPVASSTYDYAETLIEIHSHHHMQPIFSSMDNADEQGFRLYGVIGDIFERPTFNLRIGVWGHFWSIPAHWILDLPPEIECLVESKTPLNIEALLSCLDEEEEQ
jgi:PRTRC genetic system protein A